MLHVATTHAATTPARQKNTPTPKAETEETYKEIERNGTKTHNLRETELE